jgi:hypothetical protein
VPLPPDPAIDRRRLLILALVADTPLLLNEWGGDVHGLWPYTFTLIGQSCDGVVALSRGAVGRRIDTLDRRSIERPAGQIPGGWSRSNATNVTGTRVDAPTGVPTRVEHPRPRA